MNSSINTFKRQVREAFENLKVSIELDTTKRMRYIGDYVSDQKEFLSELATTTKNYEIFQRTNNQLCF